MKRKWETISGHRNWTQKTRIVKGERYKLYKKYNDNNEDKARKDANLLKQKGFKTSVSELLVENTTFVGYMWFVFYKSK